MRTVRLRHDYDAPPDRLWRLATDYGALARSCDGLVSFSGLPDGRVREGQEIDVRVRLFGRLPPQPYTMRVIACDDDAMTCLSEEKGMGVRRWRHTFAVTPRGCGSRLSEEIEIDAGPLTALYAAWARLLYSRRHPRRVEMLERQAV
ncbi:SRPBCC family protein [Tropicimonas sp. IMCC34011]|uniref:SRPBCC family protein n=1 Tax=Tropicimonas sp. IMCC34011 TaxID=2248759 RepID=UPI000E257DA8|nr:SRPBCC family protein [Tropicimonas sp. IMCC34011]